MIQLFDENGINKSICSQICWIQFSQQSQHRQKKLLEEKFKEFLYTCVPPLPFACDVGTQTDDINGNKENSKKQKNSKMPNNFNVADDNKKTFKMKTLNKDTDVKGTIRLGNRQPFTEKTNSTKRRFKCVDQSDDGPLNLNVKQDKNIIN